jgi:hypothetical protein
MAKSVVAGLLKLQKKKKKILLLGFTELCGLRVNG